MHKKVTVKDPVEDIRRAFQGIDEQRTGMPHDFVDRLMINSSGASISFTGRVHAGELRYVLTGTGDCLTQEQVDEIIKEVGTDTDGYIDYEQLIRTFVA